MAIVIGDDSDIIVCVDEEYVYESVGDGTSSGSGGVSSSWVLEGLV
jgi:hypothetical protein